MNENLLYLNFHYNQYATMSECIMEKITKENEVTNSAKNITS